MHRVFVYGTLKRGFPNFEAGMSRFVYIGRFRTVDPYPLVIGGQWYSPYLIPERGEGFRVYGEVFEVDDEGLEMLDRMEGTRHSKGYRRISLEVEDPDDGAAFEAWTYAKDRDAVGAVHSGPLEEYRIDTRYVVPSERSTDF